MLDIRLCFACGEPIANGSQVIVMTTTSMIMRQPPNQISYLEYHQTITEYLHHRECYLKNRNATIELMKGFKL